MVAAKKVDLEVAPRQFFQDKITAAKAKNDITIDNDVEFYLVALLCDFIQPTQRSPHLQQLDTPLALFLKETLEAPVLSSQPVSDSRRLSLYVSGFFQESFNRRIIDVNYYIAIGSTAYHKTAARMSNSSRHVYEKLSHDFALLVELVAEVAVIPAQSRAVDILATYDRWTRSNSQRLRQTLLEWARPIKTDTNTPHDTFLRQNINRIEQHIASYYGLHVSPRSAITRQRESSSCLITAVESYPNDMRGCSMAR